jgi:hypothetical protein
MTSPIRVRRHTDGRVAVCTGLAQEPYRWFVWPPHGRLTDEHVTGDGWSELLVAELPEPDGETGAVVAGEDARTPYWCTSRGELILAWTEGVEMPAWELQEDLEIIRADALKLLAAVAACEKYRTERETT